MRYYITRYALTEGIYSVEAEMIDGTDKILKAPIKGGKPTEFHYYYKPYWHDTLDAAIEHAEAMRYKKINSLKKQLVKIDKLDFSKIKME